MGSQHQLSDFYAPLTSPIALRDISVSWDRYVDIIRALVLHLIAPGFRCHSLGHRKAPHPTVDYRGSAGNASRKLPATLRPSLLSTQSLRLLDPPVAPTLPSSLLPPQLRTYRHVLSNPSSPLPPTYSSTNKRVLHIRNVLPSPFRSDVSCTSTGTPRSCPAYVLRPQHPQVLLTAAVGDVYRSCCGEADCESVPKEARVLENGHSCMGLGLLALEWTILGGCVGEERMLVPGRDARSFQFCSRSPVRRMEDAMDCGYRCSFARLDVKWTCPFLLTPSACMIRKKQAQIA